MVIKLRKSAFARKLTQNDRIEAMRNYSIPQNIHKLRGFLRLVNFERRFCKQNFELTLPLLRLLRNNNRWECKEEEQSAFNKIKETFLNLTVVNHPKLEDAVYIVR